MLRITSSKNAQQAKSYYSKDQSDYYMQEGCPKHISHWYGKGATKLNLRGPVHEKEFNALIDNMNPVTGQRLTSRNTPNRRPLYDFCFDVPKTVSLLYALGKDERIADMLMEATVETMAQMEPLVTVQTRTDGKKTKRTTGNWIWTPWVHETARPVNGVPDCQLHVHATALNATWDEAEQNWKAVELRPLKEKGEYFEAIFHAKIANKLRDLGYDLEKQGKYFEVAGVPLSLVPKFSNRDKVIRAEAKARGIEHDARKRSELAAITRESKNASKLSQEEVEIFWRARCTPGEMQSLMETVERARTRTLELERTPLPPPEPNPELERYALDLALRHCMERKSVVTEHEVLTFAINYAVLDRVDPERLRQQLAAHPNLIRSEDKGRRLLTSPEIVAEERALLQFVENGKGVASPLALGHWITDQRLSHEQRAAVRHVLESRDRVTGIAGRAGVGKTMVLRETVAAIEAQGRRVVTVAPTAESARDVLRKEGFAQADTVAALLVNEGLREQARGGVLLVDEAGLLSNEQMRRIFDLSSQLHARVLLVGDPDQHHAVQRGDALKLLMERGDLDLAGLSSVRRQKGLYRQGVERLADGDVAGALECFDDMGSIHEINDEDRHKDLADRYVQGVQQGKSMLVVSPTHSEIRQVTQVVREKLQSQGRLPRERKIQVLQRTDLTQAERESLVSYHEGQVLQFVKSAPGIQAGTRMEVVEVLPSGIVVREEEGHRERLLDVGKAADRFHVYERDELAVGIGERIRITQNGKTNGHRVTNGNLYTVIGFDAHGGIKLEGGMTLEKDWRHLTHGYAVSSHTSQGKSVDEVLLAMGDDSLIASNLEQFYVSVSRGRHGLHIYTHDREALLEVVQVSGRRMTALEMLDRQPREQAEPEPSPLPIKTRLGQDATPRRKVAEPLRRKTKKHEMEMVL